MDTSDAPPLEDILRCLQAHHYRADNELKRLVEECDRLEREINVAGGADPKAKQRLAALIQRMQQEGDSVDNHPLIFAVQKVHEWTGIALEVVRDAAFRLNTDFGLAARVKHGPPPPGAKELPLIATYADLTWILPRLHGLDIDGSTAALHRELWRRWPVIVSAAGIGPVAGSRSNGAGIEGGRPARPKREKASINARMIETLQKTPEAIGWNSTKWAKHLRCAKSSVVETLTWKSLRMDRDKEQAERAVDRRRKPKASDSRRE